MTVFLFCGRSISTAKCDILAMPGAKSLGCGFSSLRNNNGDTVRHLFIGGVFVSTLSWLRKSIYGLMPCGDSQESMRSVVRILLTRTALPTLLAGGGATLQNLTTEC